LKGKLAAKVTSPPVLFMPARLSLKIVASSQNSAFKRVPLSRNFSKIPLLKIRGARGVMKREL
jgi:hypothetical protein